MTNQHIELYNELKELGFTPKIKTKGDLFYVQIGSVIVKPKDYKNRYHFYSDNNYKFIDYYASNQVRERIEKQGIKEPNQVGVLSRTKVQDWINYLDVIDQELEKISKKRINKVEEFLKSLKKHPVKWMYEDFEIQKNGYTSHVDMQGEIIKNGLRYTFSIDRNSGYISEKIEIIYNVNKDLETFLKMSDNQLTNYKY